MNNNKEHFFTLYTANLARLAKEGVYGWPAENSPIVAARMRVAFENGSFNHDGAAFKATCKEVGLNAQGRRLKSFVKDREGIALFLGYFKKSAIC